MSQHAPYLWTWVREWHRPALRCRLGEPSRFLVGHPCFPSQECFSPVALLEVTFHPTSILRVSSALCVLATPIPSPNPANRLPLASEKPEKKKCAHSCSQDLLAGHGRASYRTWCLSEAGLPTYRITRSLSVSLSALLPTVVTSALVPRRECEPWQESGQVSKTEAEVGRKAPTEPAQ